ncbi:hypothetical protein GEA64_07320 [Photorhabdus khanii]|uniref:Inclusion body protein n=1 Tax=Photorhabdus khanii TaxID=1004150 RepID=A0A7C9GIL6_9GAMM|nr:AidA/PixA family protein [Photorhabdus khanii]MQL47798.1 hypothetical protein [Photorhabdus khanii]
MSEQIIDILVTVDVKSILPQLSQNKDNPGSIGNSYIYMIAHDAEGIKCQAESELNITASNGDVIRWREASLSIDGDYSLVFYDFYPQGNNGFISDISFKYGNEMAYVPVEYNNRDVKVGPAPGHYWEVDVLRDAKKGEYNVVTYQFWFQVLDSEGHCKGYGSWDPYITIKQRED